MDSGDHQRGGGCPNSFIEKIVVFAGLTTIPQTVVSLDKSGNLNGGTVNAVFLDGHVQEVRSALGEDPTDTSEMEYGRFEKYGWPHRTQPLTP